VLDEPTEGIQPSIIKQIGEVIRNLAARRDMAILLVEQYYDFAEALADRHMVMSRGDTLRAGSDMAGRCANCWPSDTAGCRAATRHANC
jgi:urea transport system ATP-binding protein